MAGRVRVRGGVAAACLECGVTRLYSEDLPGRAVRGPLEIVNPFLQLD